MLILYWSLFFTFSIGSLVTEFSDAGFSTTAQLNETDLTSEEIDSGGLFNTGVSFGRFFSFMVFGIGLPDDTPLWFVITFGVWQTAMTIFTAGFIISSIWDG